ncbi:MAG: hypothetical protein WD649_03165 [Thermoleophilaceae bacterium]
MARALHPTENRGYRELYAYSRQLVRHWSSLAERLDGFEAAEALQKGVDSVSTLIEELAPVTACYGVHGYPAAEGVGTQLARARTDVRDRALERNQALRLAVQDMQGLTTLLAYLGRVAQGRRDQELVDFCGRWERRLRRVESAARKAAVELGSDADAAIEPVDPSAIGRVAHGAAHAIGTAGEWFDRRTATKRGE